MLLYALLLSQVVTVSTNEPSTASFSSTRTVFSCDPAKVSFDYENDWANGNRGFVRRVMISDKDLPKVANYLTKLAHNRSIKSITVIRCGGNSGKLHVVGEIMLSQLESVRDRLPAIQLFEFDQDGRIGR